MQKWRGGCGFGGGEVGLVTRSIRSFWVKDTSTVAAARNVSPHWSGTDLGGECRGWVPPPGDDLRFSNTTGILQKKKLCGLLVLK